MVPRRGAVALGLLAFIAAVAVVFLSGRAAQPSSLLVWGPPTIRPAPKASRLQRTQALSEHSDTAPRVGTEGNEAALKQSPVNVVIKQDGNSRSSIAPVEINLYEEPSGAFGSSAPQWREHRNVVEKRAHATTNVLREQHAWDAQNRMVQLRSRIVPRTTPSSTGPIFAEQRAFMQPIQDLAPEMVELISPRVSRAFHVQPAMRVRPASMWGTEQRAAAEHPHPHVISQARTAEWIAKDLARRERDPYTRLPDYGAWALKRAAEQEETAERSKAAEAGAKAVASATAKSLQALAQMDVSDAALEAMPYSQLAVLKGVLQARALAEETDAISAVGAERAQTYANKARTVGAFLAKLPTILPSLITEAKTARAQSAVAVKALGPKLAAASAALKKAEKEAGPKSEREAVERVRKQLELQHAAAVALADIEGRPAPAMLPLPDSHGSSEKLRTLRSRVARIERELASNKAQGNEAHARMLSLEADKLGLPGTSAKSVEGKKTMLAESDERDGEQEEEGDGQLVVDGHAVVNPAEEYLYPKATGFKTWNGQNGRHEEETPEAYRKLNEEGPLVEGPRLRWCKWATQMVPCAPGHGGAWLEHHVNDRGIWEREGKKPPRPERDPEHVHAGGRSQSYLDDLFSYGKAGIFGARKRPVPRGRHPRAPRSMLAAAKKEDEYDRLGVHGLVDPNLADDMLSRGALEAAGLPTRHPENDPPGAVFGIQDPAVFDEAMKPKPGLEWKGDYRDAAAVWGIQDPAVFDEAIKGTPPKPNGPVFPMANDIVNPATVENFLLHDPDAFQVDSLRGSPVGEALAHDRGHQLATLNALAHVSLH